MSNNKKRATAEEMDELHHLTVQQVINLMRRGRPVISRETGEPVIIDGEVLYTPPTSAELTAAARILKDNGIDSPQDQSGAAEESAKRTLEAIQDIADSESENVYTFKHR